WFRTVIENVPEVCTTPPASHFCSAHTMAIVCMKRYIFVSGRSPEAGPTSPRFKLRVRVKQWLITTNAAISSFVFAIPIGARESAFRPFAPGDIELFWTQLLAPLGVRFFEFVVH